MSRDCCTSLPNLNKTGPICFFFIYASYFVKILTYSISFPNIHLIMQDDCEVSMSSRKYP